MSNRLGGKQGTAYLGTNANQPPNWVFSDRDPNQYDVNNVSLGDLWLNQIDESAWLLVSLAGIAGSKGSLATWVSLSNDGVGSLSTLTANTGGVIAGDINANINVVGDNIGITIAGNPATNTLTASLVGGGIAAQSFPTDGGTAIPVAGVLNVIADNANLNSGSTVLFTGIGDTITLNVTDSSDNTIIGRNSGSLTMTGGDNVILGEASGVSLTSGSDNIIIGGTASNALSSGSNNIVIGSGAGSGLTTSDSSNTVIGASAFIGAEEFVAIAAGAGGSVVFHNYPGANASTTNGKNIFVGNDSGNFTLAGAPGLASNAGLGNGTLQSLTTGSQNNSIGAFSLAKVTTGTNNTALGHSCGFDAINNTGLTAGIFNTLIGYAAGNAYIGAESNNVILGGADGVVGDNNTLRIAQATGTGAEELNRAFIEGIYGITPDTADGIPVFISSEGQLVTVGTGGATFVSTATGNTGGAVGPLAGNINIVGDGTTATVVGNPGTNTLTISSLGGGGGDLTVLTADLGSATPAVGTINIVTNNAAQAAGSSVLFSGTSNIIQLHVSDVDDNTLIGEASGNATLTGSKNVALGTLTANAITSGTNNAMLGYGAGSALTSGSYNTFVGYLAGSAYVSTETSNISINAIGTVAESNVLRIGAGTGTGSAQINKAFVSGIRGITPSTADGIPVFIGSTGQLGTVGNGGTTMIQTVTGNSGGAVGPASGNINIVGDGTTIQITGNPGTNTLTVVGLGGGGGDLSILTGDTGSATAAAGTINVKTNNSTQECGSSVLFTGSSNNLILDVTDVNHNTLIGYQSGNNTIAGVLNTALGSQCAKNLTTGSSNILLGIETGSLITTGSGNILCGDASTSTMLKGTTTSAGLYGFGANGSVFLHNFGGFTSGNTFVGYGSAGNFNAGQQLASRHNTACGVDTLSLLTTGVNNTVLGWDAGSSLTSGTGNTLLGTGTGANYVSSEIGNICIGVNTTGTAAESNALRIGAGTGTGTGQINKTFISGIRGITTGISNAIPVVIDSAGQLGTAGGATFNQTLTGNSGGVVSSTAGNINIVGDGTSVNVVGNPGTSTLTISAVGSGAGAAFLAHLTNPFGMAAATPTQVTYDTLQFNRGGAFNIGTSTFTAPTTGLYNFSCSVGYSFGSSSTSGGYIKLITSNFSYIPWYALETNIRWLTGPGGTSIQLTVGNDVCAGMDIGDTATVETYSIFSSTILGTASPNALGVSTYFGGSLI